MSRLSALILHVGDESAATTMQLVNTFMSLATPLMSGHGAPPALEVHEVSFQQYPPRSSSAHSSEAARSRLCARRNIDVVAKISHAQVAGAEGSAGYADPDGEVSLLSTVETFLIPGVTLRVSMGAPSVPDVKSAGPAPPPALFLPRFTALRVRRHHGWSLLHAVCPQVSITLGADVEAIGRSVRPDDTRRGDGRRTLSTQAPPMGAHHDQSTLIHTNVA